MAKLKHDFFHNALGAFVSHFSKNIEPYRELMSAPVPVSIVNTGDEVFLSTMTFKSEDDQKKLYKSNPRISFGVAGVSINSDGLTSPHTLGRIVTTDSNEFDNPERAHVRRVPVKCTMTYEIVFSNIDQYFKFIDVILTVINQPQIFEFVYAGTVHRGSYRLGGESFDSTTNLALSHDSEKRRRILDNSLEVSMQFPAFDVYSVNGHTPEVFSEDQRMNKLIHNVYINGDEMLVSTTVIPDCD